MAYFAAKVFVYYSKELGDKARNLEEKMLKAGNSKQLALVDRVNSYDPKYFVQILQTFIQNNKNPYAKLKGTFMLGLFYWFVDKEFK